MWYEIWSQFMGLPGVPDLLVFLFAGGLYLLVVSKGLRPPHNERLQALGTVCAVLGLGNILLAVALHVDFEFQMLKVTHPTQAYTATEDYQNHSSKYKVARETGGKEAKYRKGAGARGKDSQSSFHDGTWERVREWQGRESRNTEIFAVRSRQWAVDWATTPEWAPGIFGIKVYRRDGKLVASAAGTSGPDKDFARISGSGHYYLAINSTQKYKVIIWAKKPGRPQS